MLFGIRSLESSRIPTIKRSRAKSKLLRELVLVNGECLNLVPPSDKHIDNKELNALVPSSSESGYELHGLSPDVVSEAERHVGSCIDCSGKVSKYWLLVSRFANAEVSEAVPPGPDCPNESDVDWHQVAAALCPELKARQLIMHAALCDHCGPLLRAATSVDSDPPRQEEKLLAELRAPSRTN